MKGLQAQPKDISYGGAYGGMSGFGVPLLFPRLIGSTPDSLDLLSVLLSHKYYSPLEKIPRSLLGGIVYGLD